MAHSEIRLSVAEERTIYDVAAIERAMEDAAGNRNEALATLCITSRSSKNATVEHGDTQHATMVRCLRRKSQEPDQ